MNHEKIGSLCDTLLVLVNYNNWNYDTGSTHSAIQSILLTSSSALTTTPQHPQSTVDHCLKLWINILELWINSLNQFKTGLKPV